VESGSRAILVTVKLLLVDDDTVLTASLRRGLEAEGFVVDVSADGLDALWRADEGGYGAIILDLMLPGRNGFAVCADLRQRGDWTPILVLSAKGGEYDQAEALDTGADDYLTKPFSFAVLLAHVRALLRRAEVRTLSPIAVGDLSIDPARMSARRGSRAIELTTRQFHVLEHLVRHAGEVVGKRDLLDAVWSSDFEGDPNIVEVYVHRLRRQIDEPFDRHSLQTIRGAGYRLVDDMAEP
jgi:two-component system OmpR family response regulator